MKPSLTSVSRRPDAHGSYVKFMSVESIEMSIAGKNQLVNFFARLGKVLESHKTFTHVLTECLNKREKHSASRPGAGASNQFAAFYYRPCLPVRH